MSHPFTVYQCHSCGLRSITAPGYCSRCRSKQSYALIGAEGRGTVLSYTTVYVCEQKWQAEAPYQLAVIECEGGLRVLGRIADSGANPVKIGASVAVTEIRDGVPFFHIMQG